MGPLDLPAGTDMAPARLAQVFCAAHPRHANLFINRRANRTQARILESRENLISMKQQRFEGEARERMILWIRRRMAEYGIGIEQLEASIELDLDLEKSRAPKYRDAQGNVWDGQGEMPSWLRRAQNAGLSIDFFLISEREDTQQSTQDLPASE